MSVKSANTIIEVLRNYTLPKHVLPMLEDRQPFKHKSSSALRSALEITLYFPEKRGIFSHAARSVLNMEPLKLPEQTVTIEAHFDSVDLPREFHEQLMRLGFEPDGFHEFNPSHFSEHHTLKFKSSAADQERLARLTRFLRRAGRLLKDYVEQTTTIEAYLEVEKYETSDRHAWSSVPFRGDWFDHLPISEDRLNWVHPPRTRDEAERSGTALELAKRADIHMKLSPKLGERERELFVEQLSKCGFYRVITWSGNHVCTGQFSSGAFGRTCFEDFVEFFNKFGGCTEITFEPAMELWRSNQGTPEEPKLSTLPPLILNNNSQIGH